MNEVEATVEQVADRLVGPRIRAFWSRFGPLSVGALGGAVTVLGTIGTVRALVRWSRGGRLPWVGALVAVPVAIALFARELDGEGAGEVGDDDRHLAPSEPSEN